MMHPTGIFKLSASLPLQDTKWALKPQFWSPS